MKRHGGTSNAYYEVKGANPNSYILYDSNCVEFWKRQSYRDSKKISGRCRVGRWIGGAQGIVRAVQLFCMILKGGIHVIMYLSNPTEWRVNPNRSYAFWVITMCRHSLSVMADVPLWWGISTVRESVGMWDMLSAQFFCKPKMVVKNKVHLKRWMCGKSRI